MPDEEAIRLLKETESLLARADEALKAAIANPREAPRLAGLVLESVKEARSRVAAVQSRIAGPTKPAPEGAVRTDRFMNEFRNIMQRIQLDVHSSKQPFATTVRALDIELRGLITVLEDGPYVITPTVDRPVDGTQLSLIKMSFGSVPVVPRGGGPPAPPEEAPGDPSSGPASPRADRVSDGGET